MKVLSDEVKRKQYDTYGAAGFDASRAGAAGQQQYYRAGGTNIDPEELFRKIFGEFTGGMGFGGIHNMFEQRPEVRTPITVAPTCFDILTLNHYSTCKFFSFCYLNMFILIKVKNSLNIHALNVKKIIIFFCLSTVCDGAYVFRGSEGCE